MQPAPRPHRPRPTPAGGEVTGPVRPSPRPRPQAQAAAPAPSLSPQPSPRPAHTDSRWASARFGAVLRPDSSMARRASVGAIGAGVALFAVATITTPLAGADPDAGGGRPAVAAAPTTTSPDVPEAFPTLPRAGLPTPLVKKDAVAEKAPVDARAISALAANGIPEVALNAYRVAAARLANVDPGCGIDWSLLAGIGRQESDHGRFAGSVLHTDGTSTPAIVGPALTGAMWEYFKASPEYVAITGDTKYAHALGPMQFIPTTWAGYGADATGDGKADVLNINDAALGTARYLCAAGGDLTTQAGRVKAVLTYNNNDQYLAQVLALADAYKRGVPISGIPVGITSGKLPKVKPGKVPVANPGAPTAADPSRAKSAPTKAASPSPKPSSSSKAGGAKSTPAPTRTKTTPKPSASPTKATPTPTPTTKSCAPLDLICMGTP